MNFASNLRVMNFRRLHGRILLSVLNVGKRKNNSKIQIAYNHNL
jgi:hypothetical protein